MPIEDNGPRLATRSLKTLAVQTAEPIFPRLLIASSGETLLMLFPKPGTTQIATRLGRQLSRLAAVRKSWIFSGQLV